LSREHLQIEIDDRDEELEEKRIRIRDLRNNYGELEEMGLRLLNAFFQKEVELRKEKVIANSYKTQRD
jgi:hypothetical protein